MPQLVQKVPERDRKLNYTIRAIKIPLCTLDLIELHDCVLEDILYPCLTSPAANCSVKKIV